MIKAIKQFIGFIFFVGPIALFWFIPWYWVILYYNLYWTYTSYILYEANKDDKELSLLYCLSLPLLFNFFGFLVVILTESKSKKVNEESSSNDSSDTLESNQIVVKTNKELRERLNTLGISDDNLQSINVKLNLNKWATYESDVNVMGLEYKGYKYDLVGYIQEKRNDAELVEEIKSLNEFFKIIKDKEIDRLDYDFEYYKNGESDYHYIDEVDWFDKMPPKEIIEEFDAKYKKGKYHQYDELIDQGETVNLDESRFLNEFNNIDMIVLKLKVQDIEYSIHWNNHNAGKCVDCDVEVEKGIRFCVNCEKKREKTIKSLDKALDRLEKIYPTKTEENDESSENNKTEKSSYQKAIDLEYEQRVDREARVDVYVSEEEFNAEPIKSLYNLSKELSKEEYLKKAKQIWKEFITNFLKKHYKESDAEFYGKIDQDKDLFLIDLEYTKDDHYRLCPRLRMSNYDYLLEYSNINDTYDLEEIFDGYQIAYIPENDNKTGESRIVFLANSSWNGNYTEDDFEEMGGWDMYGLDIILPAHDEDLFYKIFYTTFDINKENTSYEEMASLFFSFDEICEYLAKCPIYDYKEALEAGALGEDIYFRSFDISKMENSTYTKQELKPNKKVDYKNREVLTHQVEYGLFLEDGGDNQIEVNGQRHLLVREYQSWDEGQQAWCEYESETEDEFYLTGNDEGYRYDEDDLVKFFEIENWEWTFNATNIVPGCGIEEDDDDDTIQKKWNTYKNKFPVLAEKSQFGISNIEKTKNDINFCPNCGVKITEKINFCVDCGQKLN